MTEGALLNRIDQEAVRTPANDAGDRTLRSRQSRKTSLLEATTNLAIGFLLSFILQGLLYPALGIISTGQTNLVIAAAFTLASLVRSYLVRRAFEGLR